jgi:hypothetical protein
MLQLQCGNSKYFKSSAAHLTPHKILDSLLAPTTPRRAAAAADLFWSAARRRRRPKMTGAPPPTL